MDPLTKKAAIFLIVFVILSVAQRLTGVGSQPQLMCQLRNTFQMKTSMKRIGGSPSLAGGAIFTPSLGFGTLETMLRKLCRKGDEMGSTSSSNRMHMLATPLKSMFGSQRSQPNSVPSESSDSPGAGHQTSFDAYDDE
ncbi:hypothetical protein V9T40_014549 [Parthenolecanium corni]|uniref:Uncharacterized protein n=1 Tax=Parthenolecanium corni TaxID=536013 RepID=A0AAN9T549_9HEMI